MRSRAQKASLQGVLIRALEPLEGDETMHARRGRSDLTNGPARLTQALGIGPELQGHSLDQVPLMLVVGQAVPDLAIKVTSRIGISRAVDRPLRFYDRRSPWVSKR